MLALGLMLGACQPGASSGPPASSSASAEGAPSSTPVAASSAGTPQPSLFGGPGRIVFTQFQPSTGKFTVLTMNPDGSGLTILPVGGPPMLVRGSLRASAVARWSPDGRRIAITTSSASGAFETIVNTDGTGARALIRPDPTLDLRCLAWSPDGQRLACQGSDSTKQNRQGMYTVRSSDGGGLLRLTTSSGAGDVPGDYSPDGTQIAFVRQTYSIVSLGQLWVCNADGSNVRKLTDTLVGYDVSWSPDGHSIAGDANGALLIFDLDHLGVGPREIVVPKGSAAQPRWSPDGSRLVFQFASSGGSPPDIYVVNADGSNPRQLTTNLKSDDSPDWGRVQ
jgi:Tol biopolymer transport system component